MTVQLKCFFYSTFCFLFYFRLRFYAVSLRKLAQAIYSDFFSAVKIWNISLAKIDIFYVYAQNIDCGYPQSMFWIKNKKKLDTPANLIFTYIHVGLKGVFIAWKCYSDVFLLHVLRIMFRAIKVDRLFG